MSADLDLTDPSLLTEEPSSITERDADLLFRQARTVRTFTDQPVTQAELQAAWDLAKWGPTAMNAGPLRVLVVATPAARERLAAHMNDGNKQRVLDAPASLVLAADPRFHTTIPVLAPHATERAAQLESAPQVRAAMARTNALLQAGYLIVALRAVGLGVGPMSGMDAAGIDADLLAEDGWSSLMVLNVGHVAGDGDAFPRAARLDWTHATRTL